MRGKKLCDILTPDEIRKKTDREIHEPYGLAPPDHRDRDRDRERDRDRDRDRDRRER